MKLLVCISCADVLALQFAWRECRCGQSAGRYREDGEHAEIDGPQARCMSILNAELSAGAHGVVMGGEWRMRNPDTDPRVHRGRRP